MSRSGLTVLGAGCVAATVTACGDPGPAIQITHGALIEDHRAMAVFGCGADERIVSSLTGTTVLSPAQHSVSRRLVADVALSTFELDVNPVITGDRSGALTLTARAHVEDNRCGTGCEGTLGQARFSWSGEVSLPPAAAGYAVHLDVHAERATSSGPSRFPLGECAIEVPWRPLVVVDSGNTIRDFDAPAGEATIRVTCARPPERSFAAIGCFGAPHSGSPERQGFDSTVTVSLRVRMEFAPRAE
ncbi:MAG: hypothetical protein Q8S73_03380 [Deltaproteobacteria bacterium]|nr:hypothetical protein [Myxococcales bacterium]MDP3213121.1 hypothetical protein [Deltaproteobacteria bacterium]